MDFACPFVRAPQQEHFLSLCKIDVEYSTMDAQHTTVTDYIVP